MRCERFTSEGEEDPTALDTVKLPAQQLGHHTSRGCHQASRSSTLCGMQEQRGAAFVDEPIDTSPAEKRTGNEALTIGSQRWIKPGRGSQPLGEGVQQLSGEP